MRKRTMMLSLLVFSSIISVSTANGQKQKKEHKSEATEINAAIQRKNYRLRGPRSIKPIHVNRIRYIVTQKETVTLTGGPDLSLVPIIPQLPKEKAADTEAGAGADLLTIQKRSSSAQQQFDDISKLFNTLLNFKTENIVNPISDLLAKTEKARKRTEDFVRGTDGDLAGVNGPQTVLGKLPALISQIDAAKGDWPDTNINQFLGIVDILENELDHISDVGWLVAHKNQVDALRAKMKDQRTKVVALSHDGPADGKALKFDEAQQKLSLWRDIFADAQAQGESFFDMPTIDGNCNNAFDQNKETTIMLVKQDRLAADAKSEEQELVTVYCSSPFSISGGFAFSSVNEREFVFVPSTKTVTENGQQVQKVINRFGFKNNSSFRPIPLLLLNTRVHEWSDDVALHLSAGAGVDLKTGEAGTDIEYVVGPSISFKRSMFITAGAHIARVPKLAGGFQLDQEVPEGISAPPVEKAWKPGFIISFTYKLR